MSTRSRRARQKSCVGLIALVGAVAVLAANVAPVAADHDLFRRISAGQINGNGSVDALAAGASNDGKRVFFTTSERLTPNDSDSAIDVYQRSGSTTTRISIGARNGNGNVPAAFKGSSVDGAHVFFETAEQLASADSDASVDIYERSGSGTTLVSAGAINGNGAHSAVFKGVSADGSRVFFASDEPLTSADTDQLADIYMRTGGVTTLLSAAQINSADASAIFKASSGGGGRVWFETTQQMLAADTDTSTDVYEWSGGQLFLISRGQINGNGTFPATSRAHRRMAPWSSTRAMNNWSQQTRTARMTSTNSRVAL